MNGSAIDHKRSTENAARQWYLRGFEDAMKLLPNPSVAVTPPTIKIDISDFRPLRWRTGPVPEGLAVFYKYFLDGFGVDYEVGEGNKEGNVIGNFHTEWQNIQWIHLSDILGLVENPQGGEG